MTAAVHTEHVQFHTDAGGFQKLPLWDLDPKYFGVRENFSCCVHEWLKQLKILQFNLKTVLSKQTGLKLQKNTIKQNKLKPHNPDSFKTGSIQPISNAEQQRVMVQSVNIYLKK